MLLIKPKHSLTKSFTHKKRNVLESQISTKNHFTETRMSARVVFGHALLCTYMATHIL